jgi:hypothetical protein
VAASQTSPLVTEWPASEKANLESLLRQGSVAVSYSGCLMRVLPNCRVGGGYVWQRTTPASDYVEINNEDDLYAKLPLGAASLEGELKRTGHLSVQTIVTGLLRLANPEAVYVSNEGECAQATHVVESLSIGAFNLTSGGSAGVGASAGVSMVQVGGHTGGSRQSVRSSGDPYACNQSTDQAPHPNCSAPIQVFLRPLPGRAAEEGPPGTVRADFVSAYANSRWDVYIDDQVACTTPCSKWVDASRPILLRAREDGFLAAPDKIQMAGGLGPNAVGGPVQVQAHPTARGQLATGITFTSFGGMAVLTGITLSAVSCSSDRFAGMCTGGLISLGAGSLVTAGAIMLILDSAPKAKVLPMMHASSETGDGTSIHVGPGFIAGRF